MEEKINLQKYLSDNSSNLYGYLKKEIANAIKVDDLKNVMTLYFRNEDFMGMYFCGSLSIKFGAKDYHDCASRPDIVINLSNDYYAEYLDYLKKKDYYFYHMKRFNDGKSSDSYYKYDCHNGKNMALETKRNYTIGYDGSLKEAISFNESTNYFDYYSKIGGYNNKRVNHIFLNNEYFATNIEEGYRSDCYRSAQALKRLKEFFKDDSIKKYYEKMYRDFNYSKEKQDKLKSKMFEFSKSVLSEYEKVVNMFKKSIGKSPITCDGAWDFDTNFIVEKNEVMFKDDDKDKTLTKEV
ncbi:unknown [Clostridium sp. CAG:594]|nr:unknown [Clostridium sp. CAG:594]